MLNRRTVDLSAYPDLIVIYLGMKVESLKGIATLIGFGPGIQNAVAAKPDGLLLHEQVFYSVIPPHVGMRQYWRDFESLEKFARSLPHKDWWVKFLREPAGVGFWHETYSVRGGFEAVYAGLDEALGFGKFAPEKDVEGSMLSARMRLKR